MSFWKKERIESMDFGRSNEKENKKYVLRWKTETIELKLTNDVYEIFAETDDISKIPPLQIVHHANG